MMIKGLWVIGTNYKKSDASLRERLYRDPPSALRLAEGLVAGLGFSGCIVLSTCNRTEFYLEGPAGAPVGEGEFLGWLSAHFELAVEGFEDLFYSHRGTEAVAHLFSVVSSLDSMIYGENQIQNQVRQTLENFQATPLASPLLRKLFQAALAVGRRVRAETGLGRKMVSISSAAVDLARKIFGPLYDSRVLVIGTGEVGELTMRHLREESVRELMVTNRTEAGARSLVEKFSATFIPFADLPERLHEADIVISQTASPHPIITESMVSLAAERRHYRPMFFIDIAIPRDISPGCAQFENIYLFGIDDLQHLVAFSLREKSAEFTAIQTILDEEKRAFLSNAQSRELAPIIRQWRDFFTRHATQEQERLFQKMPDLSLSDRQKISKSFHQLVNKVLHQPTVILRELPTLPDPENPLEPRVLLARLFGEEGGETRADSSPEEKHVSH